MDNQLPLDWPRPHQMSDTSLLAYASILPTLSQREIATFVGLCDYLEHAHQADATGGELAVFLGTLTTSIRPRLTGLHAKGWIVRTDLRPSRARYEGTCHGYAPAVPREAVERVAKPAETPRKSADLSGEENSEGVTVGGTRAALVTPSPVPNR